MEEAPRKKNSPRIKCGRVTLVPYDERMIQRYCGWFLDDHLCEMTATGHLTLEEARDAYRTWTSDSRKTMFIVLDNDLLESTGDDVASMIGDANIVLSPVDKLDGPICCEVMLMVAGYQSGLPAGFYNNPESSCDYNQPQIGVIGSCPACRVGVPDDHFTCCGILCAIFLFPIGLICCLATRQRRCSNCGAVFG